MILTCNLEDPNPVFFHKNLGVPIIFDPFAQGGLERTTVRLWNAVTEQYKIYDAAIIRTLLLAWEARQAALLKKSPDAGTPWDTDAVYGVYEAWKAGNSELFEGVKSYELAAGEERPEDCSCTAEVEG
ncbi:hypothetical protein [Thioalkalivibrio thiocyanodenitrificans]|uniref:hypothetical protein n=1 Tax=Thioalkalivibrio thiocyanodenitrificans TaxID=243063 RepID=UPI000375B0C6|nr:hypothetical protein [Thioalkalivibrio thiocyanodenitrificans]